MGGAWLLILPLEILFIFPSVPPYLGTVNVIVATDHFRSNGESPTYTVGAHSITSKAQGILPPNVTSQSSLIWHVIQQTAVTVWSRFGNDAGVTTEIVAAIIISTLTFVSSIEKFERKLDEMWRRWDVIDVVEMLLTIRVIETFYVCFRAARWIIFGWKVIMIRYRSMTKWIQLSITHVEFWGRNTQRGRSNGNLGNGLSIVCVLRSRKVGSKSVFRHTILLTTISIL